ncbi:unnamed protein product [Aphanomyces euteiches]|uniref:NAD(+) ADP-ribosyltransferase n=1 Tax=Aphanomyces euteiches TaxID=100861 RepID=A0A6G0X6T9_9STRA|nr:hypothetical protein Ae201684_007744 [Aphanomyces euteiches]KAH9067055.1 hypothetical protein Ae201684P_021227 [Aphanomyces euteiches]KAH9151436.1 hypothetical protein AeRB84_005947 [Aphanomyces euteiches]
MARTRSMTRRPVRRCNTVPEPIGCPCPWCQTWTPRKTYRKRPSVKVASKPKQTKVAKKTKTVATKAKAVKAKPAKTKPAKSKSATSGASDTHVSGQVDSAAVGLVPNGAHVAACADGNGYLDASLALVDLSQNSDKYYILQVLQAGTEFHCFSRWGRTGTVGQNQVEGPFNTIGEAEAVFNRKFQDKTGQRWADRSDFSQIDGKYDLLNVDHTADATGQWEYFMHDFVDGKARGWYPYTEDGTAQTEALWQTYQVNSAYNRRIVQSGYYSYNIDLDAMTQTNISTNKKRYIRRLYQGAIIGNTDLS